MCNLESIQQLHYCGCLGSIYRINSHVFQTDRYKIIIKTLPRVLWEHLTSPCVASCPLASQHALRRLQYNYSQRTEAEEQQQGGITADALSLVVVVTAPRTRMVTTKVNFRSHFQRTKQICAFSPMTLRVDDVKWLSVIIWGFPSPG